MLSLSDVCKYGYNHSYNPFSMIFSPPSIHLPMLSLSLTSQCGSYQVLAAPFLLSTVLLITVSSTQ